MNRRTFLQLTGTSAAGLGSGAAWAADPSASPSPASVNSDLLAEARERIARHRQGEGTLIVRSAGGQRIGGARVWVEQVRHDFLFGCNCFMVGRIQEAAIEEEYRRRFAAIFNYATLGFYWPAYEPERGKAQYSYTEQVLDWAKKNGVTCKGHPLAWDFADPRWLPRDFAEISQLSHQRVRDIIERFKGRIDIWDVVNEPTHLGRFNTRMGEWAMSLGAVPYVTEHLKTARAASAKATLLVNDYRTDRPFYEILESVQKNGKNLFNTIGIQSHMHGGGWPLKRIWTICDEYGKLELPVHFTETTVVSGERIKDQQWKPTDPEGERKQAEYVPQFYTMLFAHPAVQAVTWWDFSDRGAWQRAAAGWVRQDMSPKPVYERMLALIKGEWWTRAEGATSANGEFSTRAFYGTHRISVETPDGRKASQEVRWEKGKPNRHELVVG